MSFGNDKFDSIRQPWDRDTDPFYEDPFSEMRGMMHSLDRQFKALEREMTHGFAEPLTLFPDEPRIGHSQIAPITSAPPPRRRISNALMASPIVEKEDGTRNFKLEFDVSQFKPEEVKVTITPDNTLKVYAKHEENSGQSRMFREYSRQFALPKEVNPDTLKSVLKSGNLTIEAPLLALEGPKETIIPIQHELK